MKNPYLTLAIVDAPDNGCESVATLRLTNCIAPTSPDASTMSGLTLVLLLLRSIWPNYDASRSDSLNHQAGQWRLPTQGRIGGVTLITASSRRECLDTTD